MLGQTPQMVLMGYDADSGQLAPLPIFNQTLRVSTAEGGNPASTAKETFSVTFLGRLNADLYDRIIFAAIDPQSPVRLVGAAYSHSTAGTHSEAVELQLTKDSGVDDPGEGEALLTTAFNCKSSKLNQLQVGELVSDSSALTLESGDRLSLHWEGTLTALGGVFVVLVFQKV